MIQIPVSITKLVFAFGGPPSAHQGNSSSLTGHWRPHCWGNSGILQGLSWITFILSFSGQIFIALLLCMCAKLLQSCPTLCDPTDCSPLSMGFSGQEYWSGLPCPSTRASPQPRVRTCCISCLLHWQARSLPQAWLVDWLYTGSWWCKADETPPALRGLTVLSLASPLQSEELGIPFPWPSCVETWTPAKFYVL